MRTRRQSLLGASMLTFAIVVAAAEPEADSPVLWPEAERAFLLDGPGLLLTKAQQQRLREMPAAERREFIEEFLARDPVPETAENELKTGIERRRSLALGEYSTLLDDRAKVLFLHGRPSQRRVVECGETFVPLEVWSYGSGEGLRLLFYRPSPNQSYRLWLPLDSKRVLYNREMEYWLQQYEELKSRIRARRFDLMTCSETRLIDEVTGIEGLTGYRRDRPTSDQLRAFLAPPPDTAAWAVAAADSPLVDTPDRLRADTTGILFPERIGQRIVTRIIVTLPPEAELGTITENDTTEHRVAVDAVVEQDGQVFERFRVRFRLPPSTGNVPRALAVDRPLRPERDYLIRLRVVDELGPREVRLTSGFRVPSTPEPVRQIPIPEGVIIALGEELAERPLAGKDSLLLVPPEDSVILGVWRAEALVSGTRIVRVVFSVDGVDQLTRTRPPFSAEIRLAQFPREQIVRAEGFDEAGELVAADQVLLNQPRGAFSVRILQPGRGESIDETVRARAEVIVPDERRVESVEFLVNEELVATRDEIPWQAEIKLPDGVDVSYLTVVATLDDGSRSEAVRFLNAPRYLEEVEVDLVEVLTTVVDRANRPVRGLSRSDFEVLENGRRQSIERFELVENLPLSIGFAVDTSGSMEMALPEAQKAAIGFLENLITPRDSVFAVGFAGEPELLIPPTDDIEAVVEALRDLQSLGWTALHDAVVTSLYYFRGVRGRRALILLSDGDDSASYYPFRDSLEYARRSGVAIYTVGIGVSGLKTGIRRKLSELAEETGGRSFFIQKAEELVSVYRSIEEELRSQYLITYSSDASGEDTAYRSIEVKVRDGRLKARAVRGYYPS